MTNIRLVHTIRCDAPAFWKLFFDPQLNQALYRKALGFSKLEVLAFEETDTRITRKVAANPKLSNLPGPVAKLLGSNFGYVEDGSMDKAEGIWRFKMVPTTLADKIRQEGSVRVEPEGAHVRRIVEVVVEAKVFAIGGLVEGAAEKELRQAWETSTTYMNDWIEGKHRDLL
jgi:Protein of unknown function (DUF2505)